MIRSVRTIRNHSNSQCDDCAAVHGSTGGADSVRGGWREMLLVITTAALLAVGFTYPLVLRMGHVGRIDNGDGQFSIWNVAWVARSLILDPLHVFDANIFYPNRWTLAYSESNLGAGILAIPAYWATRNPYFAHNFVVLAAFVMSAASMYYLARYLTRDRRAAAISAICFAFCPYVFSWTAEIQLLMVAGLPLAMLAFHRAANEPTLGRGAALGAAMAGEAVCCGYYGVFLILMVGFGTIVVAVARRRWTDLRYWSCIGVAALVAIALVLPLFLPYLMHRQTGGIRRSLDEARLFSTTWRAYLASSSWAHVWMLKFIGSSGDVAFPGFVATGFGVAGAWVAWKSPRREVLALYGGLALLAVWASLGPAAGLYTVLYKTVPLFSWLHAPGRFGIVATLGLSVLGALSLARLMASVRHPAAVGTAIVALTLADLAVPFPMFEAPPVLPVYRHLATLPRGALIEMPFFYRRPEFPFQTRYMLASTAHWMPLVNGYSDYTPPDYRRDLVQIAVFPRPEAFQVLESRHPRYAIFHMSNYNAESRQRLSGWIEAARSNLRLLYKDDDSQLYEIISFAPPPLVDP
jgi:hypothetical protein